MVIAISVLFCIHIKNRIMLKKKHFCKWICTLTSEELSSMKNSFGARIQSLLLQEECQSRVTLLSSVYTFQSQKHTACTFIKENDLECQVYLQFFYLFFFSFLTWKQTKWLLTVESSVSFKITGQSVLHHFIFLIVALKVIRIKTHTINVNQKENLCI